MTILLVLGAAGATISAIDESEGPDFSSSIPALTSIRRRFYDRRVERVAAYDGDGSDRRTHRCRPALAAAAGRAFLGCARRRLRVDRFTPISHRVYEEAHVPDSTYPVTSRELAERRKEAAPAIHDAFQAFSRQVFADGALPEKTKQLIAVAVAHVTQCPYCIRSHTRLARRRGATEEEVMEAIWVAAEMRAGGAYAQLGDRARRAGAARRSDIGLRRALGSGPRLAAANRSAGQALQIESCPSRSLTRLR
jgi:AhpD family alkylhydroperoxidase